VKVLVDTSVWVDYLRGDDAQVVQALDASLDGESVLMCGPVMAELLAGTEPDDRDDVWLALGNLPWADVDRAGWRRVGEVAHDLRRRGITVPLTDVTIAVAATAAEAELWTRDDDFVRVQAAFPELVLAAR
jgi:predicted nucleic acid-binding protein